MSLFMIVGFFALTNGKHMPSTKTLPSGTTVRTNHIQYQTFLQCQSDHHINSELRVFAPARAAVLPNMTVAFVIAKAHVSSGEGSILDAYVVVPFPGDPSSNEYEDAIPDVPNPFVFVIGQVTGVDTSNPTRPLINIVTTEYIQDQFVQTNLQFVFQHSPFSNLTAHCPQMHLG